MDIVIVKLNSKNEIVFSKSIDRSWRKPYDCELFPIYSFENSEITFEDVENIKNFNGNEYIKNQNKDLGKKIAKVIVSINQETGDVKRDVVPIVK